jgi:negative regulator of flagellin synthesis FlgM
MRVDAYNQISQLYQTSKPRKTTKTGGTTATDQYKVSSKGQDYQIAKSALSTAPDVREDKVAQYKEALASGSYNVSSQEIADSLVSKFFDTIG